jgi:hypothetical protein
MKLNKYFPFAFIYFFVNSLALPFGLTYTTILAPFLYFWILVARKKDVLLPLITILAPFILIQVLYADVIRKVYFTSLLNIILLYIFCQAVYTFFKVCKNPEKIFKQLLVINFVFCIAAIIIYFTPYYVYLWSEQALTESVNGFRRLKMFVYEPSFYSLLFVPLFCFYFLQYFFRMNTIKGWVLLIIIFLPVVMSFSLGVIASLFLSGILTYAIYLRRLTKKRRIFNAIVFTGNLSLILIWPLIFFFKKTVFFSRLINFISGNDISGKGRTWDAYIIADKLIKQKNEFWGIGPGQIKILGQDLIRNYYMYTTEFSVALPNAMAETLAIFGWVGVSLRIFVEIFLFFHTKVWSNYYRLLLFFFIFIYQFTGSFITNAVEYVIWILAFTNVFRQFDVVPKEE